MLLECLSAIYAQTYPVQTVTLINNASTDGTEAALKEAGYLDKSNMDYHLMPENLGCTGGFYEGIRISHAMSNSEWCWVMDDDTIPLPDALENLVKSASILGQETSFIKSTQYDKGSDIPVVNYGLDNRTDSNGYVSWQVRLSEGYLKIRETSFVSLFLNSKAIEKCGLPCRDFFIWGDDTEYTLRFTEYYGPGYYDAHSKVIHKRPGIRQLSVLLEPSDSYRLNNYYYFYRNGMTDTIIYRGKKTVIKLIIRDILTAFRAIVRPSGLRRFWVVISGMVSGLFTWRKYYRFIQSQVKA